MTMRSSDFRSEVEPLLNEVFDGSYKEKPEQYSQVYKRGNGIKRSVHEEPVLFQFGAAQVKPSGTAIVEDEGGEAYTARYLYETYGLGFSMTEELIEDAEHITIGSIYSEGLAASMRHTRELVAANYLNRGFTAVASGGSTVGDTVPLFSASHPLASGGTESNILAVAANLSEAALEQLLVQIDQYTNQRGLPMDITPEALVVAPANRYVATRILESVLRVGTSNNDISAIRALDKLPIKPIVITRLTNAQFFMITTDVNQGFKYLDRRAMKRGMEGDFRTGNAMYKATMRFALGATDWAAGFASAGV